VLWWIKFETIPKRKKLDDEYDAIALGLTTLVHAKYNQSHTS
jgi:hypothetical protein